MLRHATYIVAALAIVVVTLGAASYDKSPYIPQSAVRIEAENSIGSGVYIGHNVILTAAHVVAKDRDGIVDVKSMGKKLFKGTVLWQSPEYDIAAIRVDDIEGVEIATLACSPPQVGDEIMIIGNPLGRYFLASWGKVSGLPEQVSRWHSIMSMDISIAPGNSGGPVYNKYGEVVGIVVNGMIAPMGLGASFTGFNGAVPARSVCELLGRA